MSAIEQPGLTPVRVQREAARVFTLDQVVPWGRSFDEYRRMFALTEADLAGPILGCADGPASFNADATRRGCRVVSCDPLYRFEKPEVEARIVSTYDRVLAQTRQNADQFVWNAGIRTVEELGQVRLASMRLFLEDYDTGKAAGRYVDAALPALPFDDRAFDTALCSHFLFLYTDQLGEAFHRAAVRDLCRVASEVRVFPLLSLDGGRSRFVELCARDLRDAGYEVSIDVVPYEFQRGGNEMMRIQAA